MHSGAFTASSIRRFKGLLGAVCWLGCYVQVLTPPPPPCFCADEMKDDFDTLGPDATLQTVGNGTGELFFLFPRFISQETTNANIIATIKAGTFLPPTTPTFDISKVLTEKGHCG